MKITPAIFLLPLTFQCASAGISRWINKARYMLSDEFSQSSFIEQKYKAVRNSNVMEAYTKRYNEVLHKEPECPKPENFKNIGRKINLVEAEGLHYDPGEKLSSDQISDAKTMKARPNNTKMYSLKGVNEITLTYSIPGGHTSCGGIEVKYNAENSKKLKVPEWHAPIFMADRRIVDTIELEKLPMKPQDAFREALRVQYKKEPMLPRFGFWKVTLNTREPMIRRQRKHESYQFDVLLKESEGPKGPDPARQIAISVGEMYERGDTFIHTDPNLKEVYVDPVSA